MRLEVSVSGGNRVRRVLDSITPAKRPRIWRDMLTDIGAEVKRSARDESWVGGGRFRGPAGPRGGVGKLMDRAPHPTMLTVRSGIGRRSIQLDASGLPRFVTVGSDRPYMARHELTGVGKAKTKRPWLQPAIDRTQRRSEEIMLRVLRRAAR